MTIKVGDTVSFVNKDTAPHDVFIDGLLVGSQRTGEVHGWTASKPGSFAIKCILTPGMTGTITVK